MIAAQLVAAAEELLDNPRHYCDGEPLVVAKIKLRDGRDAIIKLELTADENEVAEAGVWEPEQ